ncbi:four helix bundle protein [Candidatus Peribacteria bacterium]|nr:four helix bundle protein [Candidatus Peribacteria bacterium]
MTNAERQDLAERTADFGKNIRRWLHQLPKQLAYSDDAKQLLRSSGSVGANYIEANEAFTKKDCAYHLKISRKEAKESMFWLDMFDMRLEPALEQERLSLLKEARSLKLIFHSIIQKYYTPQPQPLT